MIEQFGDQPVELFAALSAGEHFVDRGGETRRIEYCLGAGLEQSVLELFLRDETGELEQTGPHEASRSDEVEQCVLREHGPALALATLEHLVDHRGGHRDDDQARDEAREQRVAQPEFVVHEVPGDRSGEEEHADAGDDPRRAHVCPKRVGAAGTNSLTSHLLPRILGGGGV